MLEYLVKIYTTMYGKSNVYIQRRMASFLGSVLLFVEYHVVFILVHVCENKREHFTYAFNFNVEMNVFYEISAKWLRNTKRSIIISLCREPILRHQENPKSHEEY